MKYDKRKSVDINLKDNGLSKIKANKKNLKIGSYDILNGTKIVFTGTASEVINWMKDYDYTICISCGHTLHGDECPVCISDEIASAYKFNNFLIKNKEFTMQRTQTKKEKS